MSRLRPEAIGAIVGVVLFLGNKLSQLASYEGEHYIGTVGLSGVLGGSASAGLMGAGIVWVCRRALGMLRANTGGDTGAASRCMRCNRLTPLGVALCENCQSA